VVLRSARDAAGSTQTAEQPRFRTNYRFPAPASINHVIP